MSMYATLSLYQIHFVRKKCIKLDQLMAAVFTSLPYESRKKLYSPNCRQELKGDPNSKKIAIYWIENITRKGENADYQHFLLYS